MRMSLNIVYLLILLRQTSFFKSHRIDNYLNDMCFILYFVIWSGMYVTPPPPGGGGRIEEKKKKKI